ncbi:hypothetical protein BKH43_07755 [Helicobacter sp. 13S00401-1]|uniref:DUF2393 family protein n=1 Tax=Helicobacter sp. 13S00401-1 TaxID=1905758 RepID=UPI000BA783E1|nr:DUF2393 family protein [Helicobacter sp. 13S00401-1]PAF48789.1 hypothetical protein BKH43_07755 [Helicobacter sp. 13S00401-1]
MQLLHSIVTFITTLSLLEIVVYIIIFTVGACFVLLAFLVFRYKTLAILSFIVGLAIIILLPFGMRYFMQERLYKVETTISKDSVLQYVNTYFLDAKVSNVGIENINYCDVGIHILRPSSTQFGFYKGKVLDFLRPLAIFNERFNMDLKVGESENITLQLNNFRYRDFPRKVYVQCHGVNIQGQLKEVKQKVKGL